MQISFSGKNLSRFLVAGSLLLSSCGKDPVQSADVTIPDSPEAATQTVITEFSSGNAGVVWDALPVSWQSDVNELVQLTGDNADPQVYNRSFELFGRLAEVVEKQKSYIAYSSLLAGKPFEERVQVEAALPSVSGLITTFVSSSIASIEGLQNFDGEAFFDETVSKSVEYVEAISQMLGEGTTLAEYASTVVSLVSADEQQATVSAAVPGQEPQDFDLTKVGQRWVPAEMASQWATQISEAKASFENRTEEELETQKTQILAALTIIDNVLSKIDSAENQEQFDQSLRQAVLPLMSVIMSFGQEK